MDTIGVLEREHHEIEDLIQRWEGGLEAGPERLEILRKTVHAIADHLSEEERRLEAAEVPVDPHTETNGKAKKLIHRLQKADELSPKVETRAEELAGLMRRHVQRQEHELFPELRGKLE